MTTTRMAKAGQAGNELSHLATLAEDVVKRVLAKGASQVEVGASIDSGLSTSVRKGEVETVERTRDRGFGLTVYFGKRKGSASTADLNPDSMKATIDQACAIARFTEEDPCAGLADADLMATSFPDLDLWHPWDIDADQAIAIGQDMEAAGLAIEGIDNSEGAQVDVGSSLGVYANSHGFVSSSRRTRHSLSCSLIARDAKGMQRDYWWDSARAPEDLMAAADIGREAGERAVAHLGAKQLSTRQCPVLFSPEMARGLIGHLVSAVSGGALYRQASFLLDAHGEKILPEWLSLVERPLIRRGPASASHDSEGVATRESALVEDGVLSRYVLSSYSARKLGLQTTANAGGVHNLTVVGGEGDADAMLEKLGTGLLVTSVMGQGVSIVTGDYSRGASGFWVENGKIAYPVEEITVAGNLRKMFAGIMAVGDDIDRRSGIMTGSILIDAMTVAGE